jgi:hypothetical protein
MSALLHVDAPSVPGDKALDLMLHHLALAGMYFEATPDDRDAFVRKAEAELRGLPHGAIAFFDALDKYYKELDQ